tara:strand:+ start:946 stop:1248 length:303 start_codon:yes stop_codon:yes gene_type:complete
MEFFIQAIDNLAKGKYKSCYSEPRSITWKDDAKDLPTEAEIDAEVVRLQAEYSATQYQRDRQYPTIGDQLDMQYHDSVDGTTTWKDAIAKVKVDNPKPTK